MNFYSDIIDTTPIERTLYYGGKTKKVYFKKIDAAARLSLMSQQKFVVGTGTTPQMEISLPEITRNQQRLVQLSNCDEEGVRLFKNLDEVQRMPAQLVEALAKLAEEVNKEIEETGKD